IGGIGPCGRPLCCASWMTNFVSVATSAARYQDISLNPQKLAGQCAKLKCCLNFEADAYVECVKQLPSKEIRLETADATYYHFKTDIFKKELTYSTDKSMPVNLVTISADRAFEIIAMNKRGEKPMSLVHDDKETEKPGSQYNDILGQDITRFDKKKKKKKKHNNQNNQNQQTQPDATNGDAERTEDSQNNRRRNNDRRRFNDDRQRNKGDRQQPHQNQNDNSSNESKD
ncbi:MAG: hypothetical protein K2K27_05560, partial [Muribaculaceae bacterium]|nr:hypothetical protein [Muribaculaceae bacterium]